MPCIFMRALADEGCAQHPGCCTGCRCHYEHQTPEESRRFNEELLRILGRISKHSEEAIKNDKRPVRTGAPPL